LHEPHDEYVVLPHESPSVLRVHGWLSIVVSTVHTPAMQRGVITERVCVALSSQVEP
jgi:hypothetical protein